jgi:hypothetical protein
MALVDSARENSDWLSAIGSSTPTGLQPSQNLQAHLIFEQQPSKKNRQACLQLISNFNALMCHPLRSAW